MCAQLLVHNSKVGLIIFQHEDGRFGHDEVKKKKKRLNRTFLFHNVPLNSSISPVFLRAFLICVRFIAAEYNDVE